MNMKNLARRETSLLLKRLASVCKGMRQNKLQEPKDAQDEDTGHTAGLFIWPVIMFLFTALGMIVGYLVLEA